MVAPEVASAMKYPKRSQYKHAKQKKYRTRNWAEYNGALGCRGDLTVWFSREAIAKWRAEKSGGGPAANESIQTRPLKRALSSG